VVKDFRVWHVRTGFFDWQINGWTFDGWVQRGDPAALATSQKPVGLSFSDYYVRALRLVRADIQNVWTGLHITEQPGDPRDSMGRDQPPTIIEDSVLTNAINISLPSLHAGNGNAAAISPRRIIIRNVKFATPHGPLGITVPRSISMTYVPKTTGLGRNYLQRDEVDVVDYNQRPGENFQVFYRERHPEFVVPVGGLILGSQSVVAAPEAGLTNRQMWERYDVAIAGAIAPCADESTYPEILGFVCPPALRAPFDTTAPSAPANVTATPISSSSIRLSWTPATDDRRFIIYSVSRNNLFTLTGSNIAGFTDTGLAANTIYTYTLYAYDAAGNRSAGSAKVTATTLAAGQVAGDLTGDGQTTLEDLRRMIQMATGHTSVDLATADLTGDGRLSLADVRALVRLLVGA
jgi:chitodextrinase